MKYEAIIFDVSDTLVEYTPNWAQIYGDRLRYLGFEVSLEKAREVSRAVNWAYGEQTWKEQCGEPHISDREFKALLDEAALTCVVDVNACCNKYLMDLNTVDIPEQKMSVIPGVIEVLGILKDRYRLAIVSNHYTWLMDYLRECGLAPYFESIVISDMVGVAKPNIRIMQIVLEELGLEAEKCLYVGDHPYDVLCSKQAGMDCAWIVADGSGLPESIPCKEDYRISKLADLLNIL